MKNVLVTGANGYIGRNLTQKLLENGFQVMVLVRNPQKMPDSLLKKSRLKVIKGDLADKALLEKICGQAEVVFHLAAVLRMFEKNHELHETNIVGLKNLLSACKKADRKIRFVFASTMDVEKSGSDYALSKLQGEKIIKEFSLQNPQVEYVISRIGNVYGGKEEGMVQGIKELLTQDTWQSAILYHQLGNRTLDLIKIENLVERLIGLAQEQKARNKTFVLFDEKMTVKQLATRLRKQKLLKRFPSQIVFGAIFIKIWQILGKIFRRGDLLVYLSLRK